MERGGGGVSLIGPKTQRKEGRGEGGKAKENLKLLKVDKKIA